VAHKVDLLLSGHDHIYERGDGGPLKYIISGGGGAPLYRISPPMLATRKAESTYHFVEVTTGPAGIKTVAHRLDGTILERCGFAKGTAWDCDALPGTSPPAAGAPSSTAPSDGPPSAPRCGCEVPGARAASALVPVALLALGALAALALARRRSRRG
jgi:MYXO-CTERM domain-containing protein